MGTLRDEIRAILREELAALRAEIQRPAVETVRITDSADLMRFAATLVERAADPAFRDAVQRGAIGFRLDQPAGAAPAPALPAAAPPAAPAQGTKSLLTEKDIQALGEGVEVIRLPRHGRLTPLAADEARRRGIKIERSQ
ncbi:hypothetical protein [Ruixingdingia sedimenti]|uniref:Uncharacterized protein n=1 Tax=Ruixingdingia sedimenti TaxID=3073604 RepID=A0ABU1F585_9RHOB|nr:hypothetical protein [Xinfangfangia sp. LG-4]MDR5652032.1 hypothetical protein [Xinfangfangia sp. LG-4]